MEGITQQPGVLYPPCKKGEPCVREKPRVPQPCGAARLSCHSRGADRASTTAWLLGALLCPALALCPKGLGCSVLGLLQVQASGPLGRAPGWPQLKATPRTEGCLFAGRGRQQGGVCLLRGVGSSAGEVSCGPSLSRASGHS